MIPKNLADSILDVVHFRRATLGVSPPLLLATAAVALLLAATLRRLPATAAGWALLMLPAAAIVALLARLLLGLLATIPAALLRLLAGILSTLPGIALRRWSICELRRTLSATGLLSSLRMTRANQCETKDDREDNCVRRAADDHESSAFPR